MEKGDGVDANLITADGVRRLLSFLPLLSEPGARHGDGPSFEPAGKNRVFYKPAILSKTAMDFVQACEDEHFVQPFDWPTWRKRHQAELCDDAFIASSDMTRIVKMLTTHIRANRFCDGHLLTMLDDGIIEKILERLNEINSKQLPSA